MNEGGIRVEQPSAGVTRIVLNRPEALNALDPDMVLALARTLDAVRDDPSCRVVVLSGEGRGFCSGQDMKAAASRNAGNPDAASKLGGQERFSGIIRRISELPQPVVAAVNGVAAGAGMGIALAADIRIASDTAVFLVASVRIGLTGGESGLSYHLPRIIGFGRAAEILMTGRPIQMDEALRIGLVNRVVPAAELNQAVDEQVQALLANSPFSLRETKRLIHRNADAGDLSSALQLEDRAQILASMTDDYKEALAAFVAKRPPVFRGS